MHKEKDKNTVGDYLMNILLPAHTKNGLDGFNPLVADMYVSKSVHTVMQDFY